MSVSRHRQYKPVRHFPLVKNVILNFKKNVLLLFTTDCSGIQGNSIVQSPSAKVWRTTVDEAFDVVECHDAGRVFHRFVVDDRIEQHAQPDVGVQLAD